MGYSNEKPDCYGDEHYYSPDDEECRECAVSSSCSIRAARRSSRSSPSSSRYSSSKPATVHKQQSSSKPTNVKRTVDEPEEGDTFAKILLHNTGLEVIQTMVDELGNSIRHIPRVDYGKYFERKKK